MLKQIMNQIDLSPFLDSDVYAVWDQLTSYLSFYFNVRCPIETFYIRPDHFSSPRIKQLLR